MKVKSPRRGFGVLAVAFIVFALLIGFMLFRKYENRRVQTTTPPVVQQAGKLTVTLFFAANDGTGLIREGRELDPCDPTDACLESVLEELVNGPVGELSHTLPPTGMFHSVRLEGDIARVDLAQEMIDGIPEGSNSELMAVISIVDSFAFNFPQVKKVIFSVDGKPMQTFKGHIDTQSPILPDFSLEGKGESLDRKDEGGKR